MPPRPEDPPVSAVVINSGGRHYDRGVLDLLERACFPSILSVEAKQEGLDIEALAAKHPRVRFLLLKEALGAGESVNIGIQEAWGDFALVIMSDMSPDIPRADAALVERLAALDALCVVPSLRDSAGSQLPGVVVPAIERGGGLRFIHVAGERDGERCLFPLGYAGFYSRTRFLLSGGYDPTIPNPWWQKADFGFRAYLWGERLKLGLRERLVLPDSAETAGDAGSDESYRRFFLKNLAVRKKGDSGVLPYSAFAAWAARSGTGLARAWREFGEAREWVRINRYRFLNDAASVVDMWGEDA